MAARISWLVTVYGWNKFLAEVVLSKALQIANEAPDIYKAADRVLKPADWVVGRLTGV
jgi:L-ribulokinase